MSLKKFILFLAHDCGIRELGSKVNIQARLKEKQFD
jgi:hypothetical protein